MLNSVVVDLTISSRSIGGITKFIIIIIITIFHIVATRY
jgi:hypothetical protein